MPIKFEFDMEKSVAAVAYFASKDLPGLTKGKLCKLIFLADRSHVLRYGRPVTGDTLSAMEHGPIPSSVLNLLDCFESGASTSGTEALGKYVRLERRYQFPRYCFLAMADTSWFSISDLKILDDVVRDYGQKSFRELRALTHDFVAYNRAWDGRGSSGSAIIRFEDLFAEEDATEAISGAREQMIENGALHEALAQ